MICYSRQILSDLKEKIKFSLNNKGIFPNEFFLFYNNNELEDLNKNIEKFEFKKNSDIFIDFNYFFLRIIVTFNSNNEKIENLIDSKMLISDFKEKVMKFFKIKDKNHGFFTKNNILLNEENEINFYLNVKLII